MRKYSALIILFLIIMLFLVACNTGGLVTPTIETEGMDFEEVVEYLDTPEKIVEYMSDNFNHYVAIYGEPPDDYNPYLPEDFFHVRIGNCEDFSAFASYVLDQHGYDVFLLYHMFSDDNDEIYGHTVCVFYTQNRKLKYITNMGISNGKTFFDMFGPFDTIEDIITQEEIRINGQIFLHGFTYLGIVGEPLKPTNFEEAVNQLTNPQQILNYITRNFQFTTDHLSQVQSPQQLFQTKEGDELEYVVFISYYFIITNMIP